MAAKYAVLVMLALVMSGCLARGIPVDPLTACRCTREYNAVCANDGITYSNKCVLECARATKSSRMGLDLEMVRVGPC